MILNTWKEVKHRKLQSVNEHSIGTAILTSVVANSFAAFGGSKGKSNNVTPDMFLPFAVEEPDSIKGQLREQISRRTAKIIINMWEKNKLPAPIMRAIAADKDFYNVVKEQAS